MKAGRKKLPKGEKRKMIRVFPKQKHIDKCGGKNKAEEIALKSIETYGD